MTTSTPWQLACRGRLRQTTGEITWRVTVEKGETEFHTSERTVTVADTAPRKPPEEPREPPEVIIVRPATDAQFAFDEKRPGVLEIPAQAQVSGDCGDAVTWRVDEVGASKRSVSPDSPSNDVLIRFEGLPAKNTDFGEKTITASACGASDSVTVRVFFPPAQTNHSGPGAGETPNWFFYWGQTRAAGGVGSFLKYARKIPASNRPGDLVIARFVPDDQKILLSDLVPTFERCTDRMLWGRDNPTRAAQRGIVLRPATGIDCFAEVVMHEWQHRVEYYQWAGKEDRDDDGVPREVEEVTVGCRDDDLGVGDLAFSTDRREKSWYSCAQRPFKDVTDREINGYYAGWKWPVGKADGEDWSRCGKQWDDASVCAGTGTGTGKP